MATAEMDFASTATISESYPTTTIVFSLRPDVTPAQVSCVQQTLFAVSR